MDILLLAYILGLAVAALFTLSSAFLGRQGHAAAPRSKALYEDEDGAATVETQKAFSTRLQTFVSSFCATAGFGLALTSAILNHNSDGVNRSPQRPTASWVFFGLWVLVLLQRLQVLRQRNPVKVYQLALIEGLTFLVAAILYLMTLYFHFAPVHSREASSEIVSIVLNSAALGVALAGFAADLTVRRRPELQSDGHAVDGLYSTTAFERYTFSWKSTLQRSIYAGAKLELQNLPLLNRSRRARTLFDRFNEVQRQYGGSLMRPIFIAHARDLVDQFLTATLRSVLGAAPQLAMFNLLRQLELKEAGANVTTQAAFWVIALGAALLLHSFFSNLLWWVTWSNMGTQMRVRISALIYAKALKRGDIRSVSKKKPEKSSPEPASDSTAATETESSGDKDDVSQGKEKGKDKAADEGEEDPFKQSRQAVVNLVNMDAPRISMAAFSVVQIYSTACALVISLALLAFLVGWQPLLAGLAVQLVFMPLNAYLSKKYVAGQDTLMAIRDKKTSVVNEALSGIRQIKFSALEREWHKKIMDVREEELGVIVRIYLFDTFLFGVWTMGPVALSLAVIATYAVIHGELPPSVAFTAISLLSDIEGMMSMMPEIISRSLEALVSVRRIRDYLNGPDKKEITVDGDQVAFVDASITWPSDSENPPDEEDVFVLRGLNINFPTGQLSVVSGPTGSGKSLLLHAILGEADLISGTITVPTETGERHDEAANPSDWIIPSARAFVNQQPWIQNMSIKDNILFRLPFYEQRYRQVISACALKEDIDMFEDGDLTEIGPNGINLSGGQKWRVALARALYSRAGVLVLDDIFSAVDIHVGRHIFENALTGDLCDGRTRILVTHHASLVLSSTKYEVHLGDGSVKYAGSVDKMKDHQREAILAEERKDEARRTTEDKEKSESQDADGANAHKDVDGQPKAAPKKFVEEETQMTGWTSGRIYKMYLHASGGWPFWIVVLFFFGGYEGLALGRSWVLKEWTDHYRDGPVEPLTVQSGGLPGSFAAPKSNANETLKFYLLLYTGFSLALCLDGSLRFFFIFRGSVKASRVLFEGLTKAVLRAPLRWLDTVPVGRILNRFTADFNGPDFGQAYQMGFGLTSIMMAVGIAVAGSLVSPWAFLCAVVLFGVCTRYGLFTITSSRQMTRLESVARSPMYDFLSATLTGISTIRAFGKAEMFMDVMFERIDAHARVQFIRLVIARWLQWRLDITGSMFTIIVATLIVGLKGNYASLGGFALSFTLQYSDTVAGMIRNLSSLELGMNSIERIVEYSEIATESEEGQEVAAHWPSEGKIEVKDLVVGYAPELAPVLKGVSFDVKGGERVGVIGRTGAGKSSLTLALFRFLEARGGSISIDGVDIAKMRLHDLRSRLAIIPQDPILFSGTIRNNLDPFDEYEESVLKDCMERVHLTDTAGGSGQASNAEGSSSSSSSVTAQVGSGGKNRALTLATKLTESGLNLSQGQRQLLCLARALVRRPRLLVLDEATSAVDRETDVLIQHSIRADFVGATLLVIAHRLSTVADFDRLLVLSDGAVAEFGSPRELLQRPGSVFAGMVNSSGEAEALRETVMRASQA